MAWHQHQAGGSRAAYKQQRKQRVTALARHARDADNGNVRRASATCGAQHSPHRLRAPIAALCGMRTLRGRRTRKCACAISINASEQQRLARDVCWKPHHATRGACDARGLRAT